MSLMNEDELEITEDIAGKDGVELDSKTSVEYFLSNYLSPLPADSVKVTSHRHIHCMEYRRVGVEGPNECRVIVERTDANKKLFLVFFKKKFDASFDFRDAVLFTFVRELTITKNKRDLEERTSENGFIAKWMKVKHKLEFGNFLYQNRKVCEINPDYVTDSPLEKRYRISFDHLNRNLVINNETNIESKRPVAEIIVMMETEDHLCLTSFMYKHFSGKGPESRKGQEKFNDYDCTAYVMKKDRTTVLTMLSEFMRGSIRSSNPSNIPTWSIFGDLLDHTQWNNVHVPSRNTPVIFHGRARNYKLSSRADDDYEEEKRPRSSRRSSRSRRTGKKKKPERDEEEDDEEDVGKPPKKKRKI